jgi:hypothetical protein
MVNPFSWGRRNVLFLALPVFLLSLVYTGPKDSTRVSQSRALQTRGAQPPAAAQVRQGRFHDWSTHHVLYPRIGTMAALEAVRRDPRALFRWREMDQQSQTVRLEAQGHQLRSLLQFRFPRAPGHFPVRASTRMHTDWNVSLGAGTTGLGQYPAKFGFDPAATPSCANDFVVFPVNANGGGTQPNIVALNNLYSGTAGGNGTCNRTASANDDGVSATVLWSYDMEGLANGTVPTSPVLSLDGTKVAFVESATGSPAHFHVLAWKAGDGQVANLQTTTSPKAINTFAATAPAAGSGTATNLVLGASATGTVTLSSPFVDYFKDVAYIGNDIGVLYRIKNVFCTTAGCAGAFPSLDSTWGTAGGVTVGCGAKLTSAVLDFVTSSVFVGCADGRVYGFNSSGTPLATASIAVGNGSANGGVIESPIVDGVNGLVYAVSGRGSATALAVIVQATVSLAGPCAGGTLCVATTGVSTVAPMHSPAFNDAYYTSATSTNWILYQVGYSSAANLTLYGATFSATRTLTTGTPTNTNNFGTHIGEYAPLTEFNNAGTDRLFFGILHTPVVNVFNMGAFPINSFPAGVTPPGASVGSGATAGPSGMIVDNIGTDPQASSIYFGALGSNTAVKLTQAGLK